MIDDDDTQLVLYQPQGFDVVMKDAPAIEVSQVKVSNPPTSLRELHATSATRTRRSNSSPRRSTRSTVPTSIL